MHPRFGRGGKRASSTVADIEKSNASAKRPPTRGRNKIRPTVAVKLVVGLEAEPNETHNAQKRNVNEVKIFEKRSIEVAARLAESVQRITKVEKSGKLATEKRADMSLQMARSVETAGDALSQLTDLAGRVELPENKTRNQTSQLSKIVKARNSAAAESSD